MYKCALVLCGCRISYLDIMKVIEMTCDKHREELVPFPGLEEIVQYDAWARMYVADVASKNLQKQLVA